MVYNLVWKGVVMNKSTVSKLFAVCLLLIGITGCTASTSGESTWEVYGGFRARQIGETPASVSVQSTVVDKIVDSLTDGEVTEEE